MARYVAFLRGMNLGKRRITMVRLRALFEEMGFAEVETFIASGNVIFTAAAGEPDQIQDRVSQFLEAGLGYPVDVFLRTPVEVTKIVRAFPEEACAGLTLHVGFLQQRLAPEIAGRLAAVATAQDSFKVSGREYYWFCRIRTSESEVWTLPDIKALRLPTSTMRNITSLRKLAARHLQPS